MTERGWAGFVGAPVRSPLIGSRLHGCIHLWEFTDVHLEFMYTCL